MSHKRRSSLLVQAGDALSLWSTKGRRKPPQPPPVLTIDHVIDISATPPDEELEERQRLRDAAAHSIGLGPLLEAAEALATPEDTAVVLLPPFPASPAALAPHIALAATIPKYYPPSSLRIFALSKQWKPRHLVLSVPTAAGFSHLHLFKGPAPDDRELERLQITADSVVFVAESQSSDPHAPAHVVKVAGADVGARRKDWNPTDDAGRTVWLLHLSPRDAQRWISAVKSAIFEQRTQRAGLAPSTGVSVPPHAHEPRGDMDVMLSMRMHASHSSSVNDSSTPSTTNNPPLPPTPTSPSSPQGYAASLAPSVSSRSVRSVATAPALSPSSPPPTRAPETPAPNPRPCAPPPQKAPPAPPSPP
ncbi:hypothetical protein B0H12DRAFT_558101 [Mycena haematopus]|nr:hypothetical protein B0H12DRAFT_558101 [Mycena haematopus]